MTHRTRIKICGITSAAAAVSAASAGADALGFVFHKPSPRSIKPEQAWELLPLLPPFVASVGLFVNASVDEFCEIEEICPTVLSQLHGQESVDVVTQCGPNIIKAVRFDEATIEEELARWADVPEVAAILVDGSAGGEGKAFDWNLLAKHVRDIDTPIIIAGGLTPMNVAEAIRIVRPYGVDVSSGVESAPGVKDPQLMAAFCKAVRLADAAAQ
ncbi:MAG: phosphoribosylanthranilate isomerase [Pyrinomonadaceae bacterium]|nr:phosphoribosylanthranilate isomerase [Phycisphaerales bacterium]